MTASHALSQLSYSPKIFLTYQMLNDKVNMLLT
ncbi:hypothetical protein TRIP_B40019 [uncultured Desulfatiglans sp.]|uniref:Uncharacterized protein n=1 Tax=Uncultured Desulfatiglans sp. TaxID=1748965 RepID=A0A653ADR6_UNCDX|nr:hypothetical protein TRIP_B40019 [uncultured Desulfatiglans sp.]